LEKILKSEVKGIVVELNKEKPRKGTFEVVCNGETVVRKNLINI